MSGILAIRDDCKAGRIDAREAWYHEDHLPSRVDLDGLVVGRQYKAVDAGRLRDPFPFADLGVYRFMAELRRS